MLSYNLKFQFLASLLSLAISFCFHQTVRAELIGVDFDLAGQSPLNWNRIVASNSPLTTATPLPLSNLKDEAGNATAVDFELASPYGFVRGFDSTPSASTVPAHTRPLHLLGGYFHNDANANDTAKSMFTSLTPGDSYRVWVFGTRTSTPFDNLVTISGAGSPVSFRQRGVGPQLFVNGELGSSSRTLRSYAVVVDATVAGSINISWTEGPTVTRYTIAALAIERVPEPSAGALMLVGVVGWTSSHRRRSRSTLIA